jgi:glycosyltransferase involved in cell wall biosynthesis
MAMGKAVVSTPAGINGLDLEPGRDVVIAEDAAGFAAAIEALSGDAARRAEIGWNARSTAVEKFDWESCYARAPISLRH